MSDMCRNHAAIDYSSQIEPMLDLDAIANKTGLLTESELTWRDEDIPLHKRGVSLGWLIDFLKEVDRNWQAVVEQHEREKRASYWFDVPEPDPLPFCANVEMTPLFVVNHVIRPITQVLAGPLFARLPTQHRGQPDLFVSHAWSNPLVGGNAFATLYALDSPMRSCGSIKYVWVDVVCYNQHRVETIANDMKAVVASIGRIGIPMINSVPFSRLWCLWELLCAHVGQAKVEVYEPSASPYDMGFLANRFREEFKSVDRAVTTLPEDREQILDAMVATFGSISKADEHIRGLANSMLSKESDKPWNRR
jgi:hypothetical protein